MAGFVLAGTGLRLWNLRDQVMGGDELHAVRAVAERPASEILTRYSLVDYSLPITAFHRLLLDWGWSLSEMGFRLPSLLCGLAALIVVPWAFAGRVERLPVMVLGWLAAISPALVLYSRIARSYMPMILLAFAAVMAFERWWNGGSRRAAVLYVVLGALAVWVHLGAGPIVAAPFVFALGDVARSRAWRRLRELAALGLALVAAMALYLVPAGRSLLRLVGNKHQEIDVPLGTVWDVLRLQAGTRSWALAALFWLAAVAGLVLLLRRQPRTGLFTLTVAGVHLAGILALSPLGLNHPIVLNRYLLPALPFVLLWVAVALGSLWRVAAGLFVVALLGLGPFPAPGYLGSSFMHHNDFVGFYSPLSTIPDEAVPAVYRQPLAGPVLEAPWSTVWEQNRTFYVYQRLHGQRVMVSAPMDVPRGTGIELRNEVEPEPAAILASPARTLIVHVRLPWEEDRVVIPGRPFTRAMRPELRRLYRRAGEKLAARLDAEWGPADVSDDRIRAWDLDRVRRKLGR